MVRRYLSTVAFVTWATISASMCIAADKAPATSSWLKPKAQAEAKVRLPDTPKGWARLDDCEFRKDKYHDGDSFHVTAGGSNYQFRLYFVDCPETDKRYNRYKEQAEDFGFEADRVLEYGEKAKEFTERALDKPFAVYTQFHFALGEKSAEPRMYAMVYTSAGENLAEALVKSGLARVHGKGTDFPDAEGRKKFYLGLEEWAGKAKVGGIGIYMKAGRK